METEELLQKDLASSPCEVNDATVPCLAEANPAKPHQARPSPSAPSQTSDQYSASLVGNLIILDSTGDSRMMWDKTVPDQVEAAQRRFSELKSKGYLAYRVDRSGRQGEVIDKFDPTAERIIMNQRMVGG